MFRIARYGGIATVAASLVAFIAWIALIDRSAAIALADVKEQLQNVRSAQYVENRSNGGVPQKARRNMVLGRYLSRTEVLGDDGQVEEIHLVDAKNGNFIFIDVGQKLFRILESQVTINIDGTDREESKMKPMPEADFYKDIRDIPSNTAKRLPETTLGDRKVVGFFVEEKKEGELWKRTFWVDPKTKLPVRVEISFHSTDGRVGDSDWVQSDFVFDEELDESLFSTEPPVGYTVETGELKSLR